MAGLTHGRPMTGRLTTRLVVAGLLLIAMSGSPGCSKDDNTSGPTIRHPEDFLPAGTDAMAKDGNARIATDTDGLRLIVNGGYQVYTNNGFREVVEQVYSGTVGGSAASVTVWIIDVGSSENADALHRELLQIGTWEEMDELGDEVHNQTALFAYTLLFRRGRYSARLVSSTSSQDAEDLVLLFATHIDQEIGS